VTALLAGTGAVIGFVLGTALLAFLQIWAPGGFNWAVDIPFGMMFGGTFGAIVGGIGAPILSWLFLRSVPLGVAIVATTIATIAGAGAGMLASDRPVLGGCAGFVIGALLLRMIHRSPTA
jgi:hypothetical protein